MLILLRTITIKIWICETWFVASDVLYWLDIKTPCLLTLLQQTCELSPYVIFLWKINHKISYLIVLLTNFEETWLHVFMHWHMGIWNSLMFTATGVFLFSITFHAVHVKSCQLVKLDLSTINISYFRILFRFWLETWQMSYLWVKLTQYVTFIAVPVCNNPK